MFTYDDTTRGLIKWQRCILKSQRSLGCLAQLYEYYQRNCTSSKIPVLIYMHKINISKGVPMKGLKFRK